MARSGAQDERVTMAEAARRLGMTQQGLGMWAQREGAPVQLVGSRRYALWPAFPVWWRQQLTKERAKPADFEEAKSRKMQAEAELAELELEARRGQLVTTALHREALRGIVTTIRAQLLAVPGRYAPRTAGLATLPESQRAWDAAVRDILNDLRDGDRGA